MRNSYHLAGRMGGVTGSERLSFGAFGRNEFLVMCFCSVADVIGWMLRCTQVTSALRAYEQYLRPGEPRNPDPVWTLTGPH